MVKSSARVKARNRREPSATRTSDTKKVVLAPSATLFRRRIDGWHWTAAAILLGAAVLRLIDLAGPVMHHDEGVNGSFLTSLFRNGYYHYDPANYHGPTLYYFAWITTTINSLFFGRDGLSTFAIRLVTVIFGLGVVWLLLCLRKQLGDFGSLAAAALAAVSPGFVFFSRYFIHEILFVFFTLGIIVAGLRFQETRQPRYLMLASLSAALLGATKETWIITIGVWLIAIPCTMVCCRLRRVASDRPGLVTASALSNRGGPQPAEPKREWRPLKLYGLAALIFAGVWVIFYSSFFTNFPKGVNDSLQTYGYWFKTSSSAHRYGLAEYLNWLWGEEAAALILGGLGIALAFGLRLNRFAVFAAFWAAGILAAYSLVPYKTPWLALNIVLPFLVIAGYGLEQLYRRWRAVGIAMLAAAVGVSLYIAIPLSFYRYDDDREAYVYAHTYRDLLAMVDKIESIAAGNPAGKKIGIVVMAPEHWPLPWYLRDYPNTGYWGKVIDTNEPILVVHDTQVPEIELEYGSRYRLIGSYDLRPGNRLYLYLRRDVQE